MTENTRPQPDDITCSETDQATACQVYIYNCPEGQRGAALAVLTNRNFGLDWGSAEAVPGELDLDHPYTHHHLRLRESANIATELIEAAPGASFVLWEQPKDEYLGELYSYTPDLGRFGCPCDTEGNPIWCRETALAALKEIMAGGPVADAEQLTAELDKRVGGRPWFDRWNAS